ncbi:DNA-binding protein, partial [Enterococcus faecalis]|nr:DNA-binding protein [Enterococcus faecalis]
MTKVADRLIIVNRKEKTIMSKNNNKRNTLELENYL